MPTPSQSQFRLLQTLFLLGLAFFLLGMGGGDDSSENTLPLPTKNYTARLVDIQGTQSETTRLSWEGKIYLKGKYGKALMTVPFNKIKRVQIMSAQSDSDTDTVPAKVTLHSGKTVELSIDQDAALYADTEFGELEILIQNLKQIEFLE